MGLKEYALITENVGDSEATKVTEDTFSKGYRESDISFQIYLCIILKVWSANMF